MMSYSAEWWPIAIDVKEAVWLPLSSPHATLSAPANGSTGRAVNGQNGQSVGCSGVRRGPDLVTRPKPCSQSVLTRTHPGRHGYPKISFLPRPWGVERDDVNWLLCESLMYEPALRIDMGETVNSSFHQPDFFLLFYDIATSGCLGQRPPECKLWVFLSAHLCKIQ